VNHRCRPNSVRKTLNLHEKLSHRESQVMSLMGAGKSPSAIAAELGLSIKTVSTYRARILEKMGMKSTVEVVRYVVVHRLSV
jgi:two-component system invasion response regulator UvrY